MTNRVTLAGRIVEAPRIRKFESRSAGGEIEIVTLWIAVPAGERFDRFTVEINDPRAQKAARQLAADAHIEVQGELRHDRWKHRETGQWTGKVFVVVDPGRGTLRVRTRSAAEAEPATS